MNNPVTAPNKTDGVGRRSLLGAAAAGVTVVVAGCASYGQDSTSAAPPAPESSAVPEPSAGSATSAAPASSAASESESKTPDAGAAKTKTADKTKTAAKTEDAAKTTEPTKSTEPTKTTKKVSGLIAVADVPVGGGTVLKSAKIVVTQPTPGKIRAFSATCTHQGCLVLGVSSGTINCPCHGSRFSPADGSVVEGPATSRLAPVAVTVTDGQVVRA